MTDSLLYDLVCYFEEVVEQEFYGTENRDPVYLAKLAGEMETLNLVHTWMMNGTKKREDHNHYIMEVENDE